MNKIEKPSIEGARDIILLGLDVPEDALKRCTIVCLRLYGTLTSIPQNTGEIADKYVQLYKESMLIGRVTTYLNYLVEVGTPINRKIEKPIGRGRPFYLWWLD